MSIALAHTLPIQGNIRMLQQHGKNSSKYTGPKRWRPLKGDRKKEGGKEQGRASISVQSGHIAPAQARDLLPNYNEMDAKLRLQRKAWAAEFRSKVNDYVYRKGNGAQPQVWPLVRKVLIEGPWPILSSGVCLVDLPGILNSSSARAKVTEQNTQHCDHIMIVAEIKRAVDDGIASKLLGEQFKQQYANVSFVCTKTDDCEVSETMNDHRDQAEKVPGRWEKIAKLSETIDSIQHGLDDMVSGVSAENVNHWSEI
eukprot:scaffold6771_cov158-Amphora_coffeaeformis.AAC.8